MRDMRTPSSRTLTPAGASQPPASRRGSSARGTVCTSPASCRGPKRRRGRRRAAERGRARSRGLPACTRDTAHRTDASLDTPAAPASRRSSTRAPPRLRPLFSAWPAGSAPAPTRTPDTATGRGRASAGRSHTGAGDVQAPLSSLSPFAVDPPEILDERLGRRRRANATARAAAARTLPVSLIPAIRPGARECADQRIGVARLAASRRAPTLSRGSPDVRGHS